MPETWTQVVDDLFTTTWAYRKKEAIQQAFLKTPFFFWLRERGRFEPVSGHTRIEIPLEYGNNDTVRWISRGSTVPMTDVELFTMAYEDWKYVAVSILRYGVDDQKNKGKARIINYVDAKLHAAERALYEEFERVAFADGSGSNEPNGLRNLIANDPTTGVVHGLNRATYEWWRNHSKAISGPASVYLVSDLRNLMNTITRYSGIELQDLFLITTQEIFELYEEETLEYKQIVNQTLADLSFQTINFKGRPILWSPSAPAGNVYVINPAYLKLVVDEDYFMEMTEWKAIPDQVNDRVAQIVCAMNLVTTRPIAEGVLTGVTS